MANHYKQKRKLKSSLITIENEVTPPSLASGVFEPNTVVVWSGLRKFEQYLTGQSKVRSAKITSDGRSSVSRFPSFHE